MSVRYINILRIVIKFVFILFLISTLLLVVLLFNLSYEDFTSKLLLLYYKQDKLTEFRLNYLTSDKYSIIRFFGCFLLLFFILVNYRLSLVSGFVSSKIVSFFNSLIFFFKSLNNLFLKFSKVERAIFFLVILFIGIIRFYFMLRFTLNVDEVTSYLFIVKKGFWATISYYPSPNNHIFYSLLAWLSQPFFSDSFYVMKAPSYIISIITTGTLIIYLSKYFNFSMSILGTLIFSFTTHYFIYSISGRGYALMTSFALLITFLSIEILSGKGDKYLWHIFSLASILGFYTMVIFLYPFVAICAIILGFLLYQKKFTVLKDFIYYTILISIGVLLLYTPVFLISGISSISSNGWMHKLSWSEYVIALPRFIDSAFIQIIDIDNNATFVGIFILVISLLVLSKTKKYDWFWLIVAFFVTPLILLTIQRIQPYERVWTYLIFPFSLCVLFILEFVFSFFPKYKNWLAGFSSVIICCYFLFYFTNLSNQGAEFYKELVRISSYISSEENVKVFTNDDSYNLFIRFEASEEGKEVIPIMSGITKADHFDYVLIVPKSKFPVELDQNMYQLKEKNNYIEVYELKL